MGPGARRFLPEKMAGCSIDVAGGRAVAGHIYLGAITTEYASTRFGVVRIVGVVLMGLKGVIPPAQKSGGSRRFSRNRGGIRGRDCFMTGILSQIRLDK